MKIPSEVAYAILLVATAGAIANFIQILANLPIFDDFDDTEFPDEEDE